MKKVKTEVEKMRAEYRREDLGPLVRGKYAAVYAKATKRLLALNLARAARSA